jgi:hypothetical protein
MKLGKVTIMTKSITMKKILASAAIFVAAYGMFGFSTNTSSLVALTPQTAQAADFTCEITTDATQVFAGSSITLTWSSSGYATVRINGESKTLAGTETINNIQINTTYTLVASSADGNTNCQSSVTVFCLPVPPPTCTLTPSTQTVTAGQSINLAWTSTNSASLTLTDFGTVPPVSNRDTGPLLASKTYTLTVQGNNNGQPVTCTVVITVTPPITDPLPQCTGFTATPATITQNNPATLTWTTQNATRVVINNGVGQVQLSGTAVVTPLSTLEYTLTAFDTANNEATCRTTVTVTPPSPLPQCTSFTATPATLPVGGGSASLSWNTTNASGVSISPIVGARSADGDTTVNVALTTTFTLTALGADNQTASCTAVVAVATPQDPTPNTNPLTCQNNVTLGSSVASVERGTSATLTWSTTGVTGVSFNQGITQTSLNGSTVVSPTQNTQYILTASSATSSIACPVTIAVTEPNSPTPNTNPLTCQNNVTFTTNATSIERGNSAVLTWSTVGVSSLSFNQGITATGLSGSTSVAPTQNTSYTLTANSATSSISCPVAITVTEPAGNGGGGGGGGGSSSPRCELTVSKSKISSGELITLRWNSTRASDIKITDGSNKTVVTTKGLLTEAKKDLFDGTKKVTPTKDTKYTLIVERGSRDTVCTATVDVSDDVAFTELREQQPLIAGIALADVPYTGFEAGPVMTLAFYTLLAAWAVFIAYLLVIRRDSVAGYKLVGREAHIVANTPTPEQIRPDVFVASVQAPIIPPSASAAPLNLPIASNTVIVGYESLVATDSKIAVPTVSNHAHQVNDEDVTTLENLAHDKKALLSSDAIRHFIATTNTPSEREKALQEVITLARGKYPSEDGWVVINEKRMQELCTTCQVNAKAEVVKHDPYVPTVIPEGSGSLAEAIVTGNVVAAYEMIGHRPMFALADAASDLDSVYRVRKGAKVGVISDLLKSESDKLSDDQIMTMIQALTGALDGVYTDEASAVKMAIMKAVKVVV